MFDRPLRPTRTLFAALALTAMIGTTAACSSDSDAAGDDPAAETTTTTMPVGNDSTDGADSDPEANEPTSGSDGASGGTDPGNSSDGASQTGSLPGDFPAIPLPDFDSVNVIGTGQMGSGQYSGRATFTMDEFRDKPVQEMIAAYQATLTQAGFSALELDDEGERIRGWSTQGEGDDENEVDITVFKDRPGEIEIGGAHWHAIDL